MTNKKPEQKLISFTYNANDLEDVSNDLKNGWSLISLTRNGNYYVGIMEKSLNESLSADSIYIPARKKIKFLNTN